MDRPLRVLDLFSGLNGWVDPFGDAGHEVFAIDIDPRFEADAYIDIGDVAAVLDAVPWRPDIIFASPPCRSFSMMQASAWRKDDEPRKPAAFERRTVWMCRLGLDRAKPTDLWGVFPPGLVLPPECKNGNPDHIAAPRGSRTGTQGGVSTDEAGRIPRQPADRFRVALEQERDGCTRQTETARPDSVSPGLQASPSEGLSMT